MARSVREAFREERGFTLVELLVTIAILGILLAIGGGMWLNVVEGNRVDSATNQALSELRLAHTSATNQLADWTVQMDADSPTYRLLKDGTLTASRTLPEETEFEDAMSIKFNSNGSAEVVTGSGFEIVVRSDDSSPQQHTIELTPATSQVSIIN